MAQDRRSYEVVEGWEQLPSGYAHRDVAGVAVDGEDRVFLICRGDHPIIVYDQKGKFLRSWGQGEFTYRTHGITIGPGGVIDVNGFLASTLNISDADFIAGRHRFAETPGAGKVVNQGTISTPAETGGAFQPERSCLAMTIRWIWLVPS